MSNFKGVVDGMRKMSVWMWPIDRNLGLHLLSYSAVHVGMRWGDLDALGPLDETFARILGRHVVDTRRVAGYRLRRYARWSPAISLREIRRLLREKLSFREGDVA